MTTCEAALASLSKTEDMILMSEARKVMPSLAATPVRTWEA